MTVTLPDVQRLLAHTETPAISLFLSTALDRRDARRGQIRLKNLLEEAEERFRDLALGDPRPILSPGWELLDDGSGWQQAGRGLALYLAPSWHELVPTPFGLPELVVVGRRPRVRPLLAGMQPDQRFYILALSRNKARLFEASRYTMRAVQLDDVPAGMEDALCYVEVERPQDIYRGHGGNEEIDDERVTEYLRAVDPGVVHKLDGKSPLVLAGVEDLHALYRRVTGYGNVLEAGVAGNHDTGGEGELHDAAWRLVEPLARKPLQDDLDAYAEEAAKGHAVKTLAGALLAALQGRVRALFLPDELSRWGTFSRETGRVQTHDRQQPGDEDLMELAEAMTLQTSGRVWVLPPGEMPGGTEIAGLTRF